MECDYIQQASRQAGDRYVVKYATFGCSRRAAWSPRNRAGEGALLYRALERLPTQRAMRLFARLAEGCVNNRRTRALVRRYLGNPASASSGPSSTAASFAWPRRMHVNPVFDGVSLGPKPLGAAVPTMGIRDAEDL